MKNVIIKNPVVIKEVKQSKEVLNSFKGGRSEILATKEILKSEIVQAEENKKEAEKLLKVHMQEKDDLQILITKGNTGLTAKLLDTQRKIRKAEDELKETEEDLKELNGLEREQAINLEKALYDTFIQSGELRKEYVSNAETLQLQYYSLMYKAFEIVQQLQELDREYIGNVDGSFRNAMPYKGFTDMFSYVPFITEVRNNFPHPNMHCGIYSPKSMNKFIDKFSNLKENETFTLY